MDNREEDSREEDNKVDLREEDSKVDLREEEQDQEDSSRLPRLIRNQQMRRRSRNSKNSTKMDSRNAETSWQSNSSTPTFKPAQENHTSSNQLPSSLIVI